MMVNLFSMFDPSNYFMSISWALAFSPFLVLSKMVMKSKNKKILLKQAMENKITKEIKDLMMESKMITTTKVMSSIFFMVLIVNLLSLSPFNFTVSSHLSINLALSMFMWMGIMTYTSMNHSKTLMIHMTPMGTPNALMNFMVLIEMTSLMIRPITLSVRLTANMVAGHLLIELLSSFSSKNFFNTTISSPIMLVLATLELAVSLIQAYVMMTLLTLYLKENIYIK